MKNSVHGPCQRIDTEGRVSRQREWDPRVEQEVQVGGKPASQGSCGADTANVEGAE